jgi:hypothetical protein
MLNNNLLINATMNIPALVQTLLIKQTGLSIRYIKKAHMYYTWALLSFEKQCVTYWF